MSWPDAAVLIVIMVCGTTLLAVLAAIAVIWIARDR